MANLPNQQGQEWLTELLQLAGINAAVQSTVPEVSLESESCWLTIDDTHLTPQQIEALIGPDGVAIDAIQYLANTTLNMGKPQPEQQAYTVELQGYRVKRQAELRDIAEQAVASAQQTGQEQVIKSLSAAERRLIHTYLKDFEGLETFSQGQEPYRYLTVRLLPSES
jgi:spoIIIJ-associated protein